MLKLNPFNVSFDKEKHEYFLDGKYLSGVTSSIGRRLNIRMPEEFVGEARQEGIHIHDAIEEYLDKGALNSVHPGALWVKTCLERMFMDVPKNCFSEVLVSDGKKYASLVDIVYVDPITKQLTIIDIKRSFRRVYVTWQLSIYKYFIEKYSAYKVQNSYCFAVRDKVSYIVFSYSAKDVEELLYGK